MPTAPRFFTEVSCGLDVHFRNAYAVVRVIGEQPEEGLFESWFIAYNQRESTAKYLRMLIDELVPDESGLWHVHITPADISLAFDCFLDAMTWLERVAERVAIA